MRFSPLLFFYRAVWEPALLLARAAALAEKLAGGALWPARWRLAERLDAGPADPAGRVWMHAASLGECKGLWAVARALAADMPETRFILTANTVEGRDFLAAGVHALGAAEAPGRWIARLAPLDHPRVVRAFLRRHAVRALVLFEVELWPHFVRETARARKPVLWISARFTPAAARRYDRFSGALRAVLRDIDWTLAQTEADAAAIRDAGGDAGGRAVETGADLRGWFYLSSRSPAAATSSVTAPRTGIALVSLHADELRAIAPALSLLPRDLPLYVFPRKMRELPLFHAALEPLGFALRSADPRATRAIVDAFGLVDETLAHCRAAVIGGSFAPHGGHNLWEPLLAGVFVLIGPRHESQHYLANALTASGLLEISPANPDLKAWIARTAAAEADPVALSRRFIENEAERLRTSLEIVRTRLVAFLE